MALPYASSIKVLIGATTSITTVSAVGTTYPGAVDVSHAQKLSLQVSVTGATTGNGIITVWVSNDGINFVPYNRLNSNVTNTNAQNDTRVSSLTISSVTTPGGALLFFPDGDYFKYVQTSVKVTGPGAYSATLLMGQ